MGVVAGEFYTCEMAGVTAATSYRERPRERLLARGASALSDAELVAVALGTGVAGHPVEEVACGLLDRMGGTACLVAAEPRVVAAAAPFVAAVAAK